MATAVKSQSNGKRSRSSKFTLLLSDEERESLSRLEEEYGLSAADVVRQFLRGKIPARAA